MNSYSSSAPGSVMLFGEHAVLHGGRALCAAVDQRIRVTLTPRADTEIHIYSDTLGTWLTNLNNFEVRGPFTFVLTVIKLFHSQLTSGFELTIQAEFAATKGLGSSSAVTVATIDVLAAWLNVSLSAMDLFQLAKNVIVDVQGVGSGADVAAAVFGGIVAYKIHPLEILPIAAIPEVVLVYSGSKLPTATVINLVSEKKQLNPPYYQSLFAAIETCTQAAIAALQNQDWPHLGRLMDEHQQLQKQLGVSTDLLDELITQLRQQPRIYGAKISGSGLGDCVMGLGNLSEKLFPLTSKQKDLGVEQIPVTISPRGYGQRIL